MSLAMLTRVLENLGPARAVDYEPWFTTVLAISNVSRGNGYSSEGRILAHAFSKLGGGKYDAASVDTKFDEASKDPSQHPVGMGSLLRWLGEELGVESPLLAAIKAECRGEAARQWDLRGYCFIADDGELGSGSGSDGGSRSGSGTPSTYTKLTKESVETAVTEIIRVLGLSHVDQESFDSAKEGDVLRVDLTASRGGTEPRQMCVELHTKELKLTVDGKDAGYLHTETGISVEYSLAALSTTFDADNISWTATRPSQGLVRFCSNTQAVIKASYFNLPLKQRSAQLCVPGAQSQIKRGVKDMQLLQTAHDGAVQSVLQGRLGLGNIFVNVQTLNVYVGGGEGDDKRQSDDKLASALLGGAPELLKRIVFAPDAASGACNGLYYCEPDTNIWARKHNAQIHQLIRREFEKVSGLSSADTSFVQNVKGQDTLRQVLAGKLADDAFTRKIDSNLDIFACSNGVFDSSDSSIPPFFCKIRVEDVVETTTGWAYDPVAAKEHRAELEAFLEQVLPFPDERQVVLTYMAHMLSGRRTAKKFLVLTDKRDGHNGKSSLAKLLLVFFGKLAMRNTPFVCKGSFDKDKSSHDAALGPTRGKRLLVADELKHTMTLDVAMFKDKAGGCTQVSGRAFGSAQQYDYTWQAGFLLIFNENDCPKIDVADQAFIGRMIVAPMRSKFVDAVGEEPYTYLLDSDLDKKFDTWRSSLADVLMQPQHQQLILLRNVPATMSEWRQGVTQGANPLADWLDKKFQFTGDKLDYILLATVEEWKASYPASLEVKSSEFRKLAKAHLIGKGGVFEGQATIKGVHVNSCFRGLEILPADF